MSQVFQKKVQDYGWGAPIKCLPVPITQHHYVNIFRVVYCTLQSSLTTNKKFNVL